MRAAYTPWLLLLLITVVSDCRREPRVRRAPPLQADAAARTRERPRLRTVRPRRPANVGEAVSAGWWIKRHAAKVARIKRGGVDLLMIGDSITHWWEHDGKQVWRRYYGKRKAVNLGFSGDRAVNVLWRLRHGEVAGISPKLAVLMIGTNNAGAGATPARTAAAIGAVVAELRQRLPSTKVLLLAIFP